MDKFFSGNALKEMIDNKIHELNPLIKHGVSIEELKERISKKEEEKLFFNFKEKIEKTHHMRDTWYFRVKIREFGKENKYFDKNYKLVSPGKPLQKLNVNKAIKYVKMGKIKLAEKAIKPAVNELIKMKCKKIILGCTELPIAIFAYKSFKKIKESKVFIDPNLLLANVSMKKYRKN